MLDSIGDSGFVGKTIYFVLFLASIWVWTIIVYKFLLFKRVRGLADAFLSQFHRARSVNLFSLNSTRLAPEFNPFFSVYQRGCQELGRRIAAREEGAKISLDERDKMRAGMDETGRVQTAEMEKYLVFLATSAAAGPLFGILGTLWGVLVAFRRMGIVGAATLDAVAPGISEALLTTVVGLGIAIPALLAYNYFTHVVTKTADRLDAFVAEFLVAAEEQAAKGPVTAETETSAERPLARPKARPRTMLSSPPPPPNVSSPGENTVISQ
ncbi:MAG: MotA/TolQ/ExbB proton channel family protein [Candidatus Aureabacteria bacterium]|nr:MotA/TolQ/ExbB proton channel family protein [Candidatus Auribacterota bacterium]